MHAFFIDSTHRCSPIFIIDRLGGRQVRGGFDYGDGASSSPMGHWRVSLWRSGQNEMFYVYIQRVVVGWFGLWYAIASHGEPAETQNRCADFWSRLVPHGGAMGGPHVVSTGIIVLCTHAMVLVGLACPASRQSANSDTEAREQRASNGRAKTISIACQT